jgi:hypothetical protein
VDAHAPDDRANGVPVAAGVVETLEDDHADTLSQCEAVGAGVERRAGTVRGE